MLVTYKMKKDFRLTLVDVSNLDDKETLWAMIKPICPDENKQMELTTHRRLFMDNSGYYVLLCSDASRSY